MKTIYYFLSNRCSYERSKILLEELNKSFHMVIFITGGLLDDGFEQQRQEMHDRYNTIELDCGRADNSLEGSAIIANRIARRLNDMFSRHRPDLLILWADRYELLPAAMMASYHQIPIAHIQGFENSGNIDNKVRYAISALADIHFVSTESAFYTAKRMGICNYDF